MYRLLFLTTFLNCFFQHMTLKSQTPKVVSGKIERIELFQSRYITERNIDIWLPEGYSSKKKYSVLYMHDGQMLYDPENAWNKQSWNIDDIASQLINNNKVTEFIVVGIWNSGQTRHPDYFPRKPYEKLLQKERDTLTTQLQRAGKVKGIFEPQSDNYLKFIVEELKPFIDKKYPVYSKRKNTFIAGSSMGGLISIYAICEYPKVFGGAACLSTHWTGSYTVETNPFPGVMINYLSKKLPDPEKHKIYFDCGDQTLDSLYPSIQKKVDSIMLKRGYNETNWITKYFEGEDHSEKAWNKRLDIPLLFLLRKEFEY